MVVHSHQTWSSKIEANMNSQTLYSGSVSGSSNLVAEEVILSMMVFDGLRL